MNPYDDLPKQKLVHGPTLVDWLEAGIFLSLMTALIVGLYWVIWYGIGKAFISTFLG